MSAACGCGTPFDPKKILFRPWPDLPAMFLVICPKCRTDYSVYYSDGEFKRAQMWHCEVLQALANLSAEALVKAQVWHDRAPWAWLRAIVVRRFSRAHKLPINVSQNVLRGNAWDHGL